MVVDVETGIKREADAIEIYVPGGCSTAGWLVGWSSGRHISDVFARGIFAQLVDKARDSDALPFQVSMTIPIAPTRIE
uniref:Uncharacterized protein n=1 Tax=Vespula pensylvanica TaxID=30213 RepID=A0A834PB59_VESPE|nr:hypothetical protein H0235_003066 [Vespula pensylvanica]